MNLKWNKLNKKQPKIGQKVIWRSLKDNGFYSIYYGTYMGIEMSIEKTFYAFRMWFNGNLTIYSNNSNVIWIPYPTGEDNYETE